MDGVLAIVKGVWWVIGCTGVGVLAVAVPASIIYAAVKIIKK